MTDAWKPKTRKVKLEEARKDFDALLKGASSGYKRLVIEQDGVPSAILISPMEYERMLLRDTQQEKAFEVVDRIRAAFADVPEEELQKEVDKAVAAARREIRKEQKAAKSA